jgi:hypothetical protein
MLIEAVIEIANTQRFGVITHLTNDEYFRVMIFKNLLQMYLRMKILLLGLDDILSLLVLQLAKKDTSFYPPTR